MMSKEARLLFLLLLHLSAHLWPIVADIICHAGCSLSASQVGPTMSASYD
jgi:hypothetical protein